MSEPKFEGKGTPISKLRGRRKRKKPGASRADPSPALPESRRARASAGAGEGKKRAEEGRKRKEEKRKKKGTKDPKKKPKAPRKGPNSKDVEQWFREGVWELFGRKFLIPSWPASCQQRALALKLLENYGPDLTKEAVMLFCQTWDQRVRESGGRLSGAPTIQLLWAMRERIFAEVQTKGRVNPAAKVPGGRDSDEYQEDNSNPGLGWG